MTATYSDEVRDARMDTINTALGSGSLLRIYDGTRPTDPDTALAGNTLLASLAMSATPFGASSAGVITAASISDDTSADNTGTPTWATITESDGTTRHVDFSCGVGSGDLNLSASITAGATVSVTSLTITEGNGG